ncbi:MAG: hypothetical protein HQ464_02780 [Planctomycetes bacterium]|nr:hypothetical protein [Planctomycetota bacterium]
MCATVVRAASIRWVRASGVRAARMTHTLLFLAATILAPGVCDACVKGCCARNVARIADVAFPLPRSADCHETSPCCSAGREPVRAAASVAPASGASTAGAGEVQLGNHGSDGCQCQLQPRDHSPSALSLGQAADRRIQFHKNRCPAGRDCCPAGVPAAWIATAVENTGLSPLSPGGWAAQWAANRFPTRPVRVLYGVWLD